VGKSITKALLTTGILTGIVYALNYVGLYNISIATAALIAYLPLVIVLAFIWYIINRISK
jgi:drug/metabolite transporter (DMT)-like permease